MASATAGRKVTDLLRNQSVTRSLSTKATRTGGPIGSDGRHKIWREGIYDHDNEPKVKRRDGSYQSIEKLRGFINYQRNPEPYRKPLERILDWAELNPVEG